MGGREGGLLLPSGVAFPHYVSHSFPTPFLPPSVSQQLLASRRVYGVVQLGSLHPYLCCLHFRVRRKRGQEGGKEEGSPYAPTSVQNSFRPSLYPLSPYSPPPPLPQLHPHDSSALHQLSAKECQPLALALSLLPVRVFRPPSFPLSTPSSSLPTVYFSPCFTDYRSHFHAWLNPSLVSPPFFSP